MRGISCSTAMTLVVATWLVGCTATSLSPPLNSKLANEVSRYHQVYLTSGAIQRPHRVVGVVQLNQQGYRWLHEKELVEGADTRSVLYYVANLAHEHGADGVQHLEVFDENPQTPAEKGAKQVSTVIKIMQALLERRPPTALADGTKTSYRVKGELVAFEPVTNNPPRHESRGE